MARLLNDWIAGYLEFSKDTEPPRSYHLWSAISVIASTLQRKVFFPWGHEKIYPNQYTILVGPSGTARKGNAMSIAKPFLDHLQIAVAPPKITREALIRFMSDSQTNFINADKDFIYQCPVTIFSKELAVFLGQKNTGLLADLTDIYDSDDTWAYLTKNGERTKDPVVGPYLTILGGTAPDWIPTMLPAEAVGGGFTSRVIFVVETGKGKVISNPNKFPMNKTLEDKLKKDLEKINLLIGKYSFSTDALAAYEAWYIDQEDKLLKGTFPIQDPRFGGYIARRATHVKKISMILTASKNDSFIVELSDFERARGLLEDTEKKMLRIFSGIGKSDIAEVMNSVLTILEVKKVIKRSVIMRMLYGDVDSWMIEKIESALTKMKLLKIEINPGEGDVTYTYLG